MSSSRSTSSLPGVGERRTLVEAGERQQVVDQGLEPLLRHRGCDRPRRPSRARPGAARPRRWTGGWPTASSARGRRRTRSAAAGRWTTPDRSSIEFIVRASWSISPAVPGSSRRRVIVEWLIWSTWARSCSTGRRDRSTTNQTIAAIAAASSGIRRIRARRRVSTVSRTLLQRRPGHHGERARGGLRLDPARARRRCRPRRAATRDRGRSLEVPPPAPAVPAMPWPTTTPPGLPATSVPRGIEHLDRHPELLGDERPRIGAVLQPRRGERQGALARHPQVVLERGVDALDDEDARKREHQDEGGGGHHRDAHAHGAPRSAPVLAHLNRPPGAGSRPRGSSRCSSDRTARRSSCGGSGCRRARRSSRPGSRDPRCLAAGRCGVTTSPTSCSRRSSRANSRGVSSIGLAVDPALAGRRVERQRAGLQHGGPSRSAPAHEGAQPGHEHDERERLRDVVVGSGLERLGQVVVPRLRGEHQDRRVVAVLPQLGAHLVAVHARQQDVEQDRGVVVLPGPPEPVVAVVADVDVEAFGTEPGGDRAGEIDLVLDEQHAHHDECGAVRTRGPGAP